MLDLLGAHWIWHPDTPEAQKRAPLGVVRFRCRLQIPEKQVDQLRFLVAAVDSSAEILVDGKMLGGVSGWTPPSSVPLKLKPGEHLLELRVSNGGGDDTNPAGLALQVGRRSVRYAALALVFSLRRRPSFRACGPRR